MSKSFQGQRVLIDLDLEIVAGEFLTLLGPSGCGKTTSLNIVAGLVQPDAGRVLLRGTLANALPPQRRRLGMVFQSWALFPHMSVFDNIAYGLETRGLARPEIRKRVGGMLDLVRLPGIEEKFPSQLSGGMQQRVALARALVTEPDLLLLDEPLSNLDAALRREMQIEIKRIHTELRVSTLLVTHSQEEALVMSDRIAVMRAGRIERIAAPMEVYNDPRTRFVCTFLGDADIFTGQVEAVEGGQALLRAADLLFRLPAAEGLVPGASATIAIRPESIALEPRAATTEPNALPATVTDSIFKGSQIAYRLEAGGQAVQALTLPPRDGRIFAPGEAVTMRIAPGAIIRLADGGPAGGRGA